MIIDKSMPDVFANGCQGITQILYPTLDDAVNAQVFADDASIKVVSIKGWKLFPTMQW